MHAGGCKEWHGTGGYEIQCDSDASSDYETGSGVAVAMGIANGSKKVMQC